MGINAHILQGGIIVANAPFHLDGNIATVDWPEDLPPGDYTVQYPPIDLGHGPWQPKPTPIHKEQ